MTVTVQTPIPTPVVTTTPGVKPGLLTTEFWLQVLAQIFLTLNTSGAWNYLHPRWASLIAQGAILGAYTLSRSWVKAAATPKV